jgi:hypothetical protein
VFWEDIEPNITSRLKAAVEHAYDVFGKYRLDSIITHCDCPVCMNAETARELSKRPLEEISAGLLGEYTNSAHGYDRETVEPEFKHFLPRYFDLIAQCQIPSPLCIEICLARLREAQYRANWPAEEIAVVEEFFQAFVEACIGQTGLEKWPSGMRLAMDLGEVLVMISLAGGDLDAALDTFDKADDPAAALHMAAMRGDLSVKDGETFYFQEHLSNFPQAARTIGQFLVRDSVTERIGNAIDLIDNPDYDTIMDTGLLLG